MTRDPVDFFIVRPAHEQIHARLTNWARWASGHRSVGNVLPMFKDYRHPQHRETGAGSIPIDSLDAIALQKLFAGVPQLNRHAIHWVYLYPFIRVEKVCRVLAVSRTQLAESIHDGRAMVKNRACTTGPSHGRIRAI